MGDIGRKIHDRRIELGLSQEELAEKVGLKHKTSISRIEHGKQDIKRKQIKAFAEALQMDPEELSGLTIDRYVKSVEYHADMLASILGYDISGEPAEGYVFLSHNGVTKEIIMSDIEQYETQLVSYAAYLLGNIFTKDVDQ